MKKFWIISLMIILIFGFVTFNLFQEVQEHKIETQSLNNALSRLQYENQRLESNLFYFSSKINQQLSEISYSENTLSTLLPASEKKLVFRFDQAHCNLCYEEELRRLNTQNPYVSSEKLIILTSFNKRDFRALKKKFQTLFPTGNFINIDRGYLNLEQEKYNEPYYFVLEKDATTHSFFFPDKALPNQSMQYLEVVKSSLEE